MKLFEKLVIIVTIIFSVSICFDRFILTPILNYNLKIAAIKAPQNLYDMMYNYWGSSKPEERAIIKETLHRILQLAENNQIALERNE